jgi:uncharacterized membrane protein YecN with MAPEG domain
MKKRTQNLSWRERYRALVSLLVIPLGTIIAVRAAMVGAQAWMLVLLGLAFIALGIVRLRTLASYTATHGPTSASGKRKRA